MVHVDPVMYAVKLCHASVSMRDLKPNTDFSLECMETLHPNTSSSDSELERIILFAIMNKNCNMFLV